MSSKYLYNPLGLYRKQRMEFFRLQSLRKRKENKDKRKQKTKSLEGIAEELGLCTPWCRHAGFPEETEMCRYSGMLKCSKYNALVGKYSACPGKKSGKD